ncbi:hypothetical protein N7448_001750 [Penicillium atrosanguineum]|nr:hypothetical protein N7448_001750 [Penicillium atrosanguineum]
MPDPPTPPDTPAGSLKDDKNSKQGNVDNTNIQNNGGVVTGNNSGYTTIVGTINITVDSAANLTDNIERFTARVATASENLQSIANRIRATSQLLSSIGDLVVREAAKKNIIIDKSFRGQSQGDNDSTLQEGARDGNVPDSDGRDGGELGQSQEKSEVEMASDVLQKTCFHDLIQASKSTTERFESINAKVRAAFGMLRPMGRDKVELSEEERKRTFLTEQDIRDMDRQIDSHMLELNIALTTFKATIDADHSESITLKLLNMFKEIKKIRNYFLGLVPENPSAREPQPQPQVRDPQYNVPHHHGPVYPPPPNQWAYSTWRPYTFPDLSRLTSLYMGWTITKGRPPHVHVDTSSSQISWRWAGSHRMALSTEDLFLRVLAQTSKRLKLKRTIQDDCKILLKSSVQKMLVDNLLRDENLQLSRQYPLLEWKLAGLALKTQKTGFFSEEMKSIEVILKTEWAADRSQGGPIRPGGGPGSPGFGFPAHGPGTRLGGGGGGGGGGWGGGGGGPGFLPDSGFSGAGRSSFNNHDPGYASEAVGHSFNDDSIPPGQPYGSADMKVQPGTNRPSSPSRRVRPVPDTTLREPRLSFVRKKAKGKPVGPIDEGNGRRVFLWDERDGSKVYAEVRRPGAYHQDNISNVIHESAGPSMSYPPPPSPVFIHNESSFYHEMAPGPEHENVKDSFGDMTIEEETRIINELFAEWEDGVNDKGKRPSRMARPMHNMEHKEGADQPPSDFGYSGYNVPRMGTTRRLMMDVEREARKKEILTKKLRETHTLEEPRSYRYSERVPNERRRRTHETRPSREIPGLFNTRESYGVDNGGGREAYTEEPERREMDRAAPPERFVRENVLRGPTQWLEVSSPLVEGHARNLEIRTPRMRRYTSGSSFWSEDEEDG